MSDGLSLGVQHQMLVAEYSPQVADKHQAIDDITEKLSEEAIDLSAGNEALVMIAAHAPESVPSDLELEVLLQRVKDTVLAYMENHAGTTLNVERNDPLVDVGLEDYKQTLILIKDRVIKALRWIGKQIVSAYKRLSDRLGRLSMRMMYIERKVDSSTDNALPGDMCALPASAAMLSLLGKAPQNASEVMNAVNKVKWLFTTVHNDYNLYQQSFKRAIDGGTRSDALSSIQDFMRHLSSRLNARVDSQRNGHEVFNQLPNGYIVEISTGDSFTDCWATINRTGVVNVSGEMTRRADRASLSRLTSELRNFLKVINELYGKVGSRLTTDFRNITRDAERGIMGDDADARAIEATINWYTEQQNRLFYRSMVMSCSVISAALDYCDMSLRKPGTGNEGYVGKNSGDDDDDDAPVTASSNVGQLDTLFQIRQYMLANTSVNLQKVSAALEAFNMADEADQSVAKLMDLDLEPLRQSLGDLRYNHWMWNINPNLDHTYSSRLKDALRSADTELDAFSNGQLEEFKTLIEIHPLNTPKTQRIMKREGYLGENGYVQYLLSDGRIPTNSAGVWEGAANGVDTLGSVLSNLRERTQLVAGTLTDSDILVSNLYDVCTQDTLREFAEAGDLQRFTAGFQVKGLASSSAFGPVVIYRAVLSDYGDLTNAAIQAGFPSCEADTNVFMADLLVKLAEMDKTFCAIWSDLNQVMQRARSVQNILADSMATCNHGKADQWILDGVNYLNLLLSELRWQNRLLRDLSMYRQGLALSIDLYQHWGGFK
jgi:hypothetical protein